MNALVVYDSKYGNTQEVAAVIAETLQCHAATVERCTPEMLHGKALIVMGSPTHRWRPSEPTRALLARLKDGELSGIDAAAFDTGYRSRFAGDAAKRINKALKRAGCRIVVQPQRFFVVSKDGPLIDSELRRVQEWAEHIVRSRTPAGWPKVA